MQQIITGWLFRWLEKSKNNLSAQAKNIAMRLKKEDVAFWTFIAVVIALLVIFLVGGFK